MKKIKISRSRRKYLWKKLRRINNKWWRTENPESKNIYAITAASKRHDIRLGWEFSFEIKRR